MKSLVTALILFTSFASAQTINLNVKNFNFSYKDPHGLGSAENFSRSGVSGAVEISVDRINTDFKLLVSGSETQEFEFKNAPRFMSDAESMSIKGFNLNLQNNLKLSLSSGKFQGRVDFLSLDGVALECTRLTYHSEIMDQLISGCIQKMVLKTSEFSSQSDQSTLVNALNQAIISVLGSLEIRSIELKTSGGKYDLAADVKAQISGKVKSMGQMSYDAVSGKLTVKISEVKFGFINITGKVFDELRNQENDKLKVKQPYVYYSIK
jgi:hypothetical protein